MPSPDVAFACGSRSTTSARSPASARQAAGRRLTGLGEGGREVDRGRRLADAALLVRERVDLRHPPNLAVRSDTERRIRKRFRRTLVTVPSAFPGNDFPGRSRDVTRL